MKKTLSKLFLKFPEGRIKNLVRFGLYQLNEKRFFSIHYHLFKDIWSIKESGIELHFKKTPYHVFTTNPLFLKYFPEWTPEIIVDGGAYHGTIGLYLAKKYPTARVIMLEPDPLSYATLLKNISLNGLKNVEAHKKGLWNRDEVLYFQQGNELSSSIARGHQANSISIETVSPQTLLKDCRDKRIFFKMNIEGAELEVLPACIDLWKQNKMKLVVASDHLVNGDYTFQFVEKLCRENRMQCETEHVGIYKTTYIEEKGI